MTESAVSTIFYSDFFYQFVSHSDLEKIQSADFIKKYNFQNSLGFGFIPTSLDDARDGMLHNLNLKCLDSSSLDALQQTIVRIWKRTLKEVSLDQLATLSKVLSFYTNYEIVHILLHCKDFQNYRILADILYYLKEDMRYFPIKNYQGIIPINKIEDLKCEKTCIQKTGILLINKSYYR